MCSRNHRVTASTSMPRTSVCPSMSPLDGDHTVGGLEFDNPNTYEIAQGSSGTLSLGDAQNFATISVATGPEIGGTFHLTPPAAGGSARVTGSLTPTVDGVDFRMTVHDLKPAPSALAVMLHGWPDGVPPLVAYIVQLVPGSAQ